jgi:hypothetical protein
MGDNLEAHLVGEWFPSSPSSLPHHDVLRTVVKPEYALLTNAELEALVESHLANLSPEEIEGFWDTLKSVGRGIAGVAKQAAPTVLPMAGTALGGLVGGPMGAQIGGTLGGLGAKLVQGPQPSTPSAAPPPAPIPGGGTSAAGQLLSLVQNPAFLQSLLGKALGPVGSSTIPTGPQGAPIPFAAVMNALGSLATQALDEADVQESDAEATRYLRDEEGNFLCDPVIPEERAQVVLEHLRSAALSSAYQPATRSVDPVTEWFCQAGLVR